MKKILSIALVVVLLCGIAVSGTMAYLTDTDSDVNVMTLGNVDIEQIELQRAEGVTHTGTLVDGDLVPFVQGQGLYPAVPANNAATDYSAEPTDLLYWGPYVTAEGAGNGLWNDDKLANVMDKMVFVENTGKSDAYYRTIIAFECPEGMEYSEGADKEFMMNVNGNTRFEWEDAGYVTIGGTRYLVQVATYQETLAPKEISRPSLLQVVMTHNATNEDMELLGDTYEILVLSQAVQTAGFDSAAEALEAAFPDLEDNVAEWFEGAIKDNAAAPADDWDGTADTSSWYNAEADELTLTTAEAVAGLAKLVNEGNTFEGKTIKLDANLDLKGENWTPIGSKEEGKYFTGTFDGNGHTVSGLKIESGDYVAFIGAAKDATIKNVTVEGTVSGEDAAGVVARVEGSTTVENCVNNADVVSSSGKAGGIACNATYTGVGGTAVFINCVNNGDVTGAANAGLGGILGYANTDAVVEMTNCKNNGDITATNDTVQYVGAAIGYAAAGSKGEISGFENSGALNGGNSLGDSLNRYLVQDSTVLAAYCGTPANWTVS